VLSHIARALFFATRVPGSEIIPGSCLRSHFHPQTLIQCPHQNHHPRSGALAGAHACVFVHRLSFWYLLHCCASSCLHCCSPGVHTQLLAAITDFCLEYLIGISTHSQTHTNHSMHTLRLGGIPTCSSVPIFLCRAGSTSLLVISASGRPRGCGLGGSGPGDMGWTEGA
jgi:hypothetical protein